MTKDTRIYHIGSPEDPAILEAAELLRKGGTVVFPTETVYGLGADALSEEAVKGIFEAKGRPSDNPLIVHVADVEAVSRVAAHLPETFRALAEAFWPGPLTLVLPKRPEIPKAVTAGLETVAVRIPVHPVARALIRAAGVPVAAPSANLSGKPSPTRGIHVVEDLRGRVDCILWGDDSPVGVESTVLDLTADPPVVLRPGGVTLEALRCILPETVLDPALEAEGPHLRPKSPGMKYTHYAPDAAMVLYEGDPDAILRAILQEAERLQGEGLRVAVLSTAEHLNGYGPLECPVLDLGPGSDPESVARNLFTRLRECNGLSLDRILAEGIPEAGMGQAVMNRLRKAAGYRIERV